MSAPPITSTWWTGPQRMCEHSTQKPRPTRLHGQKHKELPPSPGPASWCRPLLGSTPYTQRSASPRSQPAAPGSRCCQKPAHRIAGMVGHSSRLLPFACVHVHACGSQRVPIGALPPALSTLVVFVFWKQVFSLAWSLLCRLGWLTGELRFTRLCLPVVG